MRAIRVAKFGAAENLKCENSVPVPSPCENEVLVKMMAAGVNPVDTYIREGTFIMKPSLPYTPGSDGAGVVEDVGPGVTEFKKGDRVLLAGTQGGTYAEYATGPTHLVAHLDDKLSFEQGAAIGIPYYTAYRSIRMKAQAKPGETLLVHGASGAVGIAAVQMGKAFGLRVVGTAGTKEGMDLVKENGADFVFNHREKGYLQKLQETVSGVDVVLEMLSNVNLQHDLELLNSKGRVVIVGCRGTVEIDPRATMGKESCIMGVALLVSTEAEWHEMGAAIEAGQRVGWLVPHVGQVYPLKEAAKAHNDVINNTGTTGKLVIDVTK